MTALNVSELWFPVLSSSFDATSVSEETLEPVYTPSSVSKSEPSVETVAGPVIGASHLHQTVAPRGLLEWFGSPDSLVAPTLVPVAVTWAPVIVCAEANMSFDGPAPSAVAANMHAASDARPHTYRSFVLPTALISPTLS